MLEQERTSKLTNDLLNQLLTETIKLQQEVQRIRSKMESNMYKVGREFNIINNETVLITRNKNNGVRHVYVNYQKDVDDAFERDGCYRVVFD